MTGRYDRMFARNRSAFGAFLMLGDPDLATSEAMLAAAVEGGADFIEVGIPFSDPVADGPVIQAAAKRALDGGVRTGDCLEALARFRNRFAHIPVGVLTYANIAAARGTQRFAQELANAGVDSLLIADVPSLEAVPYAEACTNAGLDLVLIAAPNSSDAQLDMIARLGGGYTYCLARAGVTGAREDIALDHARLFRRLADRGAAPPVLGFGISSAEQVAASLAAGARGVISGSAIVGAAADGDDPQSAVRAAVAQLARGADVIHC